MSQSAIRGARVLGAPSGNSRLGCSSHKTVEVSWDSVPKAATENEVRLISLIKEYSAGHEDARILDNIFELLYEETSPNTMDADAGRSALHWAVLHGQTQLVRALLEAGSITNTIAKDGSTPLMVAVRKGSGEVVKALLQEGARVDLINTTTGTGPLLLACIFANTDLVQTLLEYKATPDVKWTGPNGPMTPLVAAASKVCEPKPLADQYLQVVEMLLAAGACPDIVVHQAKNETLLHNAVSRQQLGLVEALLRAGANPDTPKKDGATPLMTAVRLSSLELVEALIKGGAAVEARNELNGKTALAVACNLGNRELVELLLTHGAVATSRWFNPNDLNVPILVVASKCDDSLGRGGGGGRAAAPELRHGVEGQPPTQSPVPPSPPRTPPPPRSSGTQCYQEIVRLLLSAGADPDTRGSKNGTTPLLIAVDYGHEGLLRLLLQSGASPDLADTSGCTPLIAAASEGRAELARLLVAAGADANRQQRDGWIPLMGAVLHNHVPLTRVLLEGGADHRVLVPPGEQLAMESTPLMAACGEGALEVAKVLLEAGAHPNQTNTAGQSALWCACRGGQEAAVRMLLEAGAQLRPPGRQSAPSPLVQAAHSGSVGCVEALMAAGASVDEHDSNVRQYGTQQEPPGGGRYTPLAAACSQGAVAAAQLLLARGADPNTTWEVEQRQGGKMELVPLLAALLAPWGEGPAADEQCGVLVETLMSHGAVLSGAGLQGPGQTALALAARHGRVAALRVLLAHGAQPNVQDKDGATPLILAALKGSVACVQLLLLAGADPNATTLVGVSPLVAAIGAIASGDGNLNLVAVLLAAGANPNAPFFEDDTILTASVDGGVSALVVALLAAGADPNKPNTAGVLPLQLALGEGRSELLRALLAAGADPKLLPGVDWSAQRYYQRGRTDILKLLAAAGVEVPPPPVPTGECSSHHSS